MNYQTITDVYVANDKIRERLIGIIEHLSEEQENLPSENGKWTLGAIVEHLAKVEKGMIRICSTILSKAEAEGKTSDGSVKLSSAFLECVTKLNTENPKFEAPAIVQPEGGKPIVETLEMMQENRKRLNDLRPKFEVFDGSNSSFPHPAFGEINAYDWLVLIGGHEARHTAQIERILQN